MSRAAFALILGGLVTSCAAFVSPGPLAPGEVADYSHVSIESTTPFVVSGRTAMQASLVCPTTWLEGRLHTAQGETLEFTEIFGARYAPGAPPGCSELRRGSVRCDPALPITPVLVASPQQPSGARVLVPVVMILAVLLVYTAADNWNPF